MPLDHNTAALHRWRHRELRGVAPGLRPGRPWRVDIAGPHGPLITLPVTAAEFALPLPELPVDADLVAELRDDRGARRDERRQRFAAPTHDFTACTLPPTVVMPFHDGDAENFLAVLDLVDLHPPGRDCQFDLLYQRGRADFERLPGHLHRRLERFLRDHDGRRLCANVQARGYPAAPTLLFVTYFRELADPREQFVFWMEPDCLPLQAGWLAAVAAAVELFPHDPIVGRVMPGGRTPRHGSPVPAHYIGCSAYRPAIRDLMPWDHFSADGRCEHVGFDVQASQDLMPVLRSSHFISADLNYQPSPEELLNRCGGLPLHHGYKRAAAVRDLLHLRRDAGHWRRQERDHPLAARAAEFFAAALAARWQALRATGRPLWLYGAGNHSAWLLEQLDPASVAGIVDDAATPGQTLAGLPVLPPTALADQPPLLLLPSSDVPATANRLADRAAALLRPDDRCELLYAGFPPGPYPKDAPTVAPELLVPAPPVRQPSMVTWFITHRCNLRCAHCFDHHRAADPDDLDRGEVERFFASFPRPFTLIVTGGEPFLEPELFDRLRTLADDSRLSGLLICTNATLTERVVDFVCRWETMAPVARLSLQVSLDGLAATHDRIRGRAGAFARTLETIDRLREISRLRIVAKTVVHRDNRANILPLIRLLRERAVDHGLTMLRGNSFGLFGAAPELVADHEPESSQALDVNALSALFAEVDGAFPEFFSGAARRQWQYALKTLEKRRRVIQCGAGERDMVLYPDGGVALCEPLRTVANIRDHGLDIARLWSGEAVEQARRRSRHCACIHGCNLIASILRNEAVEAHPETLRR